MDLTSEPAVTNDPAVAEEQNELEQPMWSVISFDKCEASGLLHEEAFRKMDELEKIGIAGLCIVTDTAALNIPT